MKHIVEYPKLGGEKHTFKDKEWMIMLSKMPDPEDPDYDGVMSVFNDRELILSDICKFDRAIPIIESFFEEND